MTLPAFVPHISTTLHYAMLRASARKVDEEMRYVNILIVRQDVPGRDAEERQKKHSRTWQFGINNRQATTHLTYATTTSAHIDAKHSPHNFVPRQFRDLSRPPILNEECLLPGDLSLARLQKASDTSVDDLVRSRYASLGYGRRGLRQRDACEGVLSGERMSMNKSESTGICRAIGKGIQGDHPYRCWDLTLTSQSE
ncbi:hypothetical protein IG631_16940 [Alternaria alternata]|nr:hypothetical protein IG631_16940 [Alternaria alternata]